MGALERFRSWFTGKPTGEQVAKAAELVGQVFGSPLATSEAQGLLAGIFPSGQPPKRGTKELMLLYAASPWLRAVTNAIASSVSTTEWEAYAITPVARRSFPLGQRSVKRASVQGAHADVRRKALTRLRSAGELVQLDEHPMLEFLRRGNLMLDGRACQFVTALHLELKGEAYWLLERDEATSKPVRYWPIPPFWVYETPSVKRPFFRLTFGAWHGWIPETEMVWFRDVDPYNPYGRGVGVAESLADELDTDEYASKYIKAWFYNPSLPSAIVSMQSPNGGPVPGGKEEATRLKEEWQQNYQGFFKAFRIHFTNRQIDVKQLAQSFEEQKVVDLRQHQRDSILEAWGYPKELLGILDNANRSTIDTAAYRKEKYVVEPRRESVRHTLQQRLAPEWDERAVLDYASTVPEDKAFQLEVMKARPYDFTTNESRTLAGQNPFDGPDGDARPPLPTSSPASTPAPFGGGKAARRRKGGDDDDDLSREDVHRAVDAIKDDALAKEMKAVWDAELEKWAKATFDELGVEASFDLRSPNAAAHLRDLAGERIRGIGDTTREKVRAELLEAYDQGESIADAAARLEDSAAFDSARAETIARTEVLRSSNWGTLEAYRQSSVVAQKEWIATPGTEGSRKSHEALDGVKVDLDGTWTDEATGARAQHPGGFGDPASDINCRCTMAPVVGDDKAGAAPVTKDARADHFKAHEKRRAGWERAAKAAAAAGLAAQLKAARRALRG